MKVIPSPQWEDKGTRKEPIPNTDIIRVPRLEVDDATTFIDKDGSDNMTFEDVVTGSKTLAELAAEGGASDFVSLTDTPADFTDDGGKYVRVNTGATALEFASLAGIWLPLAGGTMAGDIALGGYGFTSSGAIYLKPSADLDDFFTFATVGGIPTIYGTGSYLRIGDEGTTAHSLDSEDDLLVTGALEVSGNAYIDNILLGSSEAIIFGAYNYYRIRHSIYDANAICLMVNLSAGGAERVPAFPIGVEPLHLTDLGLFDGITQPVVPVIEKDNKYTSGTNASSAGASATITKTDAFTNSVIGDIVRVTAGTNATAGWYWITTVTDADNVDLDRNWCTGAVSSDGVFVAYHSFTLLSAEGICTRITDGAPTDSSVEIDRDGWILVDVGNNKLYFRSQSVWQSIEAGATADQTGAEIKTAYEAEADTNAYDDAAVSKLAGIATSANLYVHPNHSGEVTSAADGAQTIANKVTMTATAPVTVSGTPTVIAGGAVAIALPASTASAAGHATAAQITKLDGIAALADVTGSNAPQAHAASHESGDGDALDIASIAGSLLYTQPEKFFLPYTISRKLSRFMHIQFDSYDMISNHVAGTGVVTQNFFNPIVSSGATSGGIAILYQNAAWFYVTTTSLFSQYAQKYTNDRDATAFLGYALSDTHDIALADVTKHCGFILHVDGATNTVYASMANGSTQETSDLELAPATARTYAILSDGTDVEFYADWVLKATLSTYKPTGALCWKQSIKSAENLTNQCSVRNFVYAH